MYLAVEVLEFLGKIYIIYRYLLLIMKLPFFWNRGEDKTLEYLQGLTFNEQQAENNAPADPYEAVKQNERDKMMLGDQTVTKFILSHPQYAPFLPALSPVNRTTKHISKSDAEVMWLDFQILFCMEEMCMSPEDYENGGLEFLQGLEIYTGPLISDGYEGWKGRITTEQKKIVSAQLTKGK